jgi:hypothetical protein
VAPSTRIVDPSGIAETDGVPRAMLFCVRFTFGITD